MNEEITHKTEKRPWIERLKEESWEAELLVSALALFGTFQLFSIIDWLANYFINVLPMHQYDIGYMITFYALIAVSTLCAMFVIHFSLRAYWVGLVGLNSVFPDYDFDNSLFSPIYTKKLVKILPRVLDTIQKVDQLCSVIFSAAFAVLFMFVYLVIFSTLYLLAFNLLLPFVAWWVLLFPAAIIATISVIQILISSIANLKRFKHNERVQHYYYIAVKLSWPLLNGPMHKNILQVFMMFTTNFKKDKALSFLIIVFLLVGTFVSISQITKTHILYLINSDIFFNSTKTYNGMYASENEKRENFSYLISPEIPSDIIQENYVKLFIPIYKSERPLQKQYCDGLNEESAHSQTNGLHIQNAYLQCYQSYHQIFLDDEELKLEMRKYDHPITKQFGVLAYIPIHDKSPGAYTLMVTKQFVADEQPIREWYIPFRK
ncbi:hypothetical protein [Glaciecola sp. KUL10]|uniref:hypothetical protein n=1 Tax=Glaciecola sp. (strain KUL10) TaxID=2161813 RepID=UPI000D788A97|nr:hypothetical protein [Glaciecola sp. KUL10]GBL04819.1 cation efflux system protein [Glaciecola sp. KUL10]